MAKSKEQGVNNKGRSGTGVWGRRFFILAVFAGGVFSCALSTGWDWVEETDRQKSIGAGAVLDLTAYIPQPQTGATPVRSFAAGSFVGVADWTETAGGAAVSGVFRAGTAYRAGVTLYPMEGYTFVEGAGFSYTGTALEPRFGTNGEAAVEIGFDQTGNDIWAGYTPAEVVGDLNLAPYIPAPVTALPPVRSFPAVGYVGTVDWTLGVTGVFQAGKQYTATVTLYAMAGYTFAGAGSFIYKKGEESLSVTPLSGGTEGKVTVQITFGPTAAEAPWYEAPAAVGANSLDLLPYIPRPADNASPVRSFVAAGFMGIVNWTKGGGGEFEIFQAGNDYTAGITLYALKGYAFTGGESFLYDNNDIKNPEPSYDDGKWTIGIAFTHTGAGPWVVTPEAITGVALTTSHIPAPKTGGTPVRSFAGADFVGTVAWKDTGNEDGEVSIFLVNKTYTAAVTVYPTAGYAFAEEVSVTYNGGTGNLTNVEKAAEAITLDIGGFSPTSAGDLDGLTTPATVASSLLDLARYIPKPVTGGTPVRSFGAGSFVGTVEWTKLDETGLFLAGTDHNAEVTLYATAGSTFTGATGFKYTGVSNSLTTNPNPAEGTQVGLTIDFAPTAEVPPPQAVGTGDLDLARYIPTPVTGGTPVPSFVAVNYVGVVTWTETAGGDHSGPFLAGTAYTATVALYATAGYSFAEIKASTEADNKFTHSVGGTVSHAAGSTKPAGPLEVTIAFTKTADLPAVTDLDLTAKVPAPVLGGTPTKSFFASQYSGTVTWKAGSADFTGTSFEGDTAYTATVTLKAAAGYTFIGIKAPTTDPCFTHAGDGVTVAHTDGAGETLVVTLTFSKTAPAPKTVGVTPGWE